MNEILVYNTNEIHKPIEVTFEKDSVWLNQSQIDELFGQDRTVVTRHISKVFKEGELEEDVVSAFFAHTTQHGAIKGKSQEKSVKYYNLDVIISVGYRVKSLRGTKFRIRTTKVLNEKLLENEVAGLKGRNIIAQGFDVSCQSEHIELSAERQRLGFKIEEENRPRSNVRQSDNQCSDEMELRQYNA